jgi:hypothetical protein
MRVGGIRGPTSIRADGWLSVELQVNLVVHIPTIFFLPFVFLSIKIFIDFLDTPFYSP